MNLIDKKRKSMVINSTIDITKFVMAILVIGIHTEPFGFYIWLDRGFGIITRLCVPFFFITSSYLYYRKKDNSPRKYLFRLLILYAVWSLIYLPIDINRMQHVDIINLIDTIFWSGYRHMWYVSCSIIGFIIVYLLGKKISAKGIVCIGLLFLLIGCIKSTWSPMISRIFSIRIDDILGSRNGLFYAFPYMALGKYVAEDDRENNRIGNTIKLMISLLLLALESYIFVVKYNTQSTKLWISVFPLTYYFFKGIISVSIEMKKIFSITLRNLSTLIYFIHPYIIMLLTNKFTYLQLFVLTTIITVIISYIVLVVSKLNHFKWLKILY